MNKLHIVLIGIAILAIISIVEYVKYGDEEIVENFAPPSEIDVATDVQLKDYINYTYGEVTSASNNCDKIVKLQKSLPTYLQLIYTKSLTADGRAALKLTYPNMLATDFDIDTIQSLYLIGTTLLPREKIPTRKKGNPSNIEDCYGPAVDGLMGDVDNAVRYLYYFYSKPTPTTPKPTDPPPAYGSPPSSVDVSTDESLKSFLTTCYITVTRTQTETGGKYSDCAKMNWCGLWIPSVLSPVANNNTINELVVNYPTVFSNNYDVDAFYGLVISASNLSAVDGDCDAKNVNTGLIGAYRDVVKHLDYFYGKPHKKTVGNGDRWDTQR